PARYKFSCTSFYHNVNKDVVFNNLNTLMVFIFYTKHEVHEGVRVISTVQELYRYFFDPELQKTGRYLYLNSFPDLFSKESFADRGSHGDLTGFQIRFGLGHDLVFKCFFITQVRYFDLTEHRHLAGINILSIENTGGGYRCLKLGDFGFVEALGF